MRALLFLVAYDSQDTIRNQRLDGAIDALRKLRRRRREKHFTEIVFQTCDQQCCAYLKVIDVTKKLKQDATTIKLEGMLADRQKDIWKVILT